MGDWVLFSDLVIFSDYCYLLITLVTCKRLSWGSRKGPTYQRGFVSLNGHFQKLNNFMTGNLLKELELQQRSYPQIPALMYLLESAEIWLCCVGAGHEASDQRTKLNIRVINIIYSCPQLKKTNY